ncbi:MAG: hypothetical protein ACLFWF_04405, partial [Alphaproteobacteria bacterium]
RVETAGDDTVIFESATNNGRHGTFIESNAAHLRAFDSRLARHNLAVALERREGDLIYLEKRRRFTKSDFEDSRIVQLAPAFTADVAFNWFDAEIPAGPVAPAERLTLAAEVDFEFALEADVTEERRDTALRSLNLIRKRLVRLVAERSIAGLCLERRGEAKFCLDAGEFSVNPTSDSETEWRAGVRFSGTAPERNGVYDLKLETMLTEPSTVGAVFLRGE